MRSESTPADGPVLQLHGVVKRFGPVTAVDGLDLQLGRAEVLALLGPNGAGKTTTVEMCEGFITPDAGTVSVLGIDPVADADQLRTRIGIMLQGGGAYPGVRVGEMLRLAASYSADPLDPDWLLETVGLAGHEKSNYRRLSGGQQQRLSLALALVGRPELVFLDEPTAGLDAQSRLAVWDLVAALRRDGVSVVLTTHLMDEAEALADKVVIIDHGAVVAQGSVSELTSTADPVISVRCASGIDLDILEDRLNDPRVSVSAVRPDRFTVTAPVSPELVTALTTAVAEQNVLITSLRVEQRSLESVFLDITGREIRA
ncbi:ABC transporter ATP-binding protein [Corynebacterium variabile]|uniref:Spermidine/putrescine ABC transporter ATP-binding protein n=1 Tax=Corynebacterium variabile TaxID=1727 RepID=A0A3B9QT46_9CORY|nr:ABC transporter ATP-binding protein [Corynebacterium variabile]HAF72166.1 spermidine/putrescine ABC transporter ATP-binding protein [Corynebacterium variabile]